MTERDAQAKGEPTDDAVTRDAADIATTKARPWSFDASALAGFAVAGAWAWRSGASLVEIAVALGVTTLLAGLTLELPARGVARDLTTPTYACLAFVLLGWIAVATWPSSPFPSANALLGLLLALPMGLLIWGTHGGRQPSSWPGMGTLLGGFVIFVLTLDVADLLGSALTQARVAPLVLGALLTVPLGFRHRSRVLGRRQEIQDARDAQQEPTGIATLDDGTQVHTGREERGPVVVVLGQRTTTRVVDYRSHAAALREARVIGEGTRRDQVAHLAHELARIETAMDGATLTALTAILAAMLAAHG